MPLVEEFDPGFTCIVFKAISDCSRSWLDLDWKCRNRDSSACACSAESCKASCTGPRKLQTREVLHQVTRSLTYANMCTYCRSWTLSLQLLYIGSYLKAMRSASLGSSTSRIASEGSPRRRAREPSGQRTCWASAAALCDTLASSRDCRFPRTSPTL
jgi:hypothetical protein